MIVLESIMKISKDYLVLIAALITFFLTFIKERNNNKKELRPIMSVERISSTYDLSDTNLKPAKQICDKYHYQFSQAHKEMGRLYQVEFIVIKNISKNIALNLHLITKDSQEDYKWDKEFYIESLLPDEHIIVPAGTPDHSFLIDNEYLKLTYKSIIGEKLGYITKSVEKVVMEREKPKRNYITGLYKYWFIFIPIPIIYYGYKDHYTFINLSKDK